jgi:uncharacterized membrane protein YkoI
MPGKSKSLVLTAILGLTAFGAGVALPTGADAGGSNSAALVDERMDEGESRTEPEEVEVDRAKEAPHPVDIAEDAAEGPDQPIVGTDLERASKVALDYMGGGRVTGTEIGDEESYYEIEVTGDDGTQVDVQLDKSFDVVGAD